MARGIFMYNFQIFQNEVWVPAKTISAYCALTGREYEVAIAEIADAYCEAKRDHTMVNTAQGWAFETERAEFRLNPNRNNDAVQAWVLSFHIKQEHFGPPAAVEHPIAKAETKEIAQHDQRELYQVLTASFERGTPLAMAKISKTMADLGHSKERYGFSKMKTLLEQLPFLTLENKLQGGVVQTFVTIHDVSRWDRPGDVSKFVESGTYLSEDAQKELYQVLSANFEKETPLAMAKISKTMADLGYSKERYGFSKMKTLLGQLPFLTLENELQGGVMQTFVTIHAAEETEKIPESTPSAEKGALPPSLDDTVHLPQKTLNNLNLAVTGIEEVPSEELVQSLREGYQKAWNDHLIEYQNGAYVFFTGLFNAEGSRVIASLKPTTFGSYHWYLNYAGVPQIETSVSPGRALEKFAFLGSWQGFLEQLAGKALPEPWDFKESAYKNNFILKKYIQYTFYRLTLEDKISISEDGSFCAFNTGLVTPYFDDIYACFEPQQEHAGVKWRFLDFCTAAARGLGKRLVECFSPLPEPASYFERKEDLLFDLEKQLHTDYEHIILDNLPRLPLDFVREECRGCGEALSLIGQLEDIQDWKLRRENYRKLSDVIGETPKLYNRMRNRLEDAIKLARKQVRWNFKTAIPCYFPTGNTMSLMLPLALQDERKTDVALVVELTRSGNYQGQTILTLQQAYVDGRLLCRPNSEWLDVREIREGDTADD